MLHAYFILASLHVLVTFCFLSTSGAENETPEQRNICPDTKICRCPDFFTTIAARSAGYVTEKAESTAEPAGAEESAG